MDRVELREDRQNLKIVNIPYGRQDITAADITAVEEVLRSDFLTQGPMVPAFERAVADRCEARYAVAVNSATSALHIACLALGVGPGDWVWTSPITFVASANCALYCGARVDFVDIDPRNYNLSVGCLEEKLAAAKVSGHLPKVVIPVHFAGQSCDMRTIHALSKVYGFHVVEDASHAIGGRYRDEPIGKGTYSAVTVFSFHPVKVITTGEGGMALTHDPEIAARMMRLRSHGITRDAAQMTRSPDGPWYYQQIELGFNYRMSDIHAALGLSQLKRLTAYVGQRHLIAKRYETLLASLPVTTPWQHSDTYSGLHLYVIRLRLREIKATHRQVFERMRSAGIGVNLHYIPVYLQPYFAQFGFKAGYCPQAELYYAEAVTLPMYPGLTESDQTHVVDTLKAALSSP
jgi:UDP-4-amino-4,6-dideoxy-N-acetyl-beta-L-altrosamine transaminase